MIVTVSVPKSPPYSPSNKCRAMSPSFGSKDVVKIQKERREYIYQRDGRWCHNVGRVWKKKGNVLRQLSTHENEEEIWNDELR